MNSLAMENNPFTEKTVVFAENQTSDSSLTFEKYEYMHIRIKP